MHNEQVNNDEFVWFLDSLHAVFIQSDALCWRTGCGRLPSTLTETALLVVKRAKPQNTTSGRFESRADRLDVHSTLFTFRRQASTECAIPFRCAQFAVRNAHQSMIFFVFVFILFFFVLCQHTITQLRKASAGMQKAVLINHLLIVIKANLTHTTSWLAD